MAYIYHKIRRFCCFIAGFVFFISGILKIMDPTGAGLVMNEYFDFLHIGFLDFASKITGTLLAFAEAVIGAAMITGVWRKVTAAAALAMQSFFTLLTLILVIFNPEMDCGCFGEAIHLTHMQTFLKNIALIILLLIAYIPFRDFGEPKKRKYVSFAIVMLSTSAFAVYSWMYIPMVDFTDYKTGAVLQASDANAPEGEMYEAVFIYEKDGNREAFTLEHLPDSTWTFISTETVQKKEVKDNSISLSFYDSDGEYRDRIAAEGKVLVISIYDQKMSEKELEKIEHRITEAEKAGFRVIVLTPALADEETARFRNQYFSDYKTILTMNRSNGGATYFSNGRLICKWAFRSFPDKEELEKVSRDHELEASIDQRTGKDIAFQGFLLYVTAVMLLL